MKAVLYFTKFFEGVGIPMYRPFNSNELQEAKETTDSMEKGAFDTDDVVFKVNKLEYISE